ncbi:ADP-heptose--LPS heptosyltransferase II [Desulfonema limicola]|uniref:lipopolysaccharide heptosyltransferase II n=1 Tax=Desulfonema limicola TaxID=45656 RepID=A0A975B576_9BACT|nr:lipopolysaccharide heptosyltransferase II [Desulfonema limicola]QTA79015.1 ADP-heptose--LPS heptosyltransferase II [Desulfonema limicola]
MNKIKTKNINRILIRAANWVGDAVMSLPMISSVRKNFPNAQIYILAKPWTAPIFENNPDIDHIIIYHAGTKHKGIWGLLRLCRELRRYRFDLAVLIPNAFSSALLSLLAGIPNRLGYNTDGRTLLLTHPVCMKPEHKKRHHIDYYMGILEGASLHIFSSKLNLMISVQERINTEHILKNSGVSNFSRIIGINPGAAFGSAKRWFPDRYARLCLKLQSIYPDLTVLVFGGPGEKELGESICRIIKNKSINLCGKTTLRQAAALIEKCRLFITNDSGLMHIAAALDIPQIAVFGPTNHTTTSPASSNSHIIKVPTPCSPCLKQECPLGHHECMKAVSIEMVFEKARNLKIFN